MGTLRYMSPEQLRGEHVDQRTDIWSLGVVLFELVTGAPPFDGQTAAEVTIAIQQAPTPLLCGSANSRAELGQIISKALEKNRDQRFARVNEMLEKLQQLRHEVEGKRGIAGDEGTCPFLPCPSRSADSRPPSRARGFLPHPVERAEQYRIVSPKINRGARSGESKPGKR